MKQDFTFVTAMACVVAMVPDATTSSCLSGARHLPAVSCCIQQWRGVRACWWCADLSLCSVMVTKSVDKSKNKSSDANYKKLPGLKRSTRAASRAAGC